MSESHVPILESAPSVNKVHLHMKQLFINNINFLESRSDVLMTLYSNMVVTYIGVLLHLICIFRIYFSKSQRQAYPTNLKCAQK